MPGIISARCFATDRASAHGPLSIGSPSPILACYTFEKGVPSAEIDSVEASPPILNHFLSLLMSVPDSRARPFLISSTSNVDPYPSKRPVPQRCIPIFYRANMAPHARSHSLPSSAAVHPDATIDFEAMEDRSCTSDNVWHRKTNIALEEAQRPLFRQRGLYRMDMLRATVYWWRGDIVPA